MTMMLFSFIFKKLNYTTLIFVAMAYIVIVVSSAKFSSINLISLLYISQGEPEFQTFVAL